MNRRERLMATLNGKPVDRPAVSFYELEGYFSNPGNPDPYNVYSDPSWKPLLDMAWEKTDLMCFTHPLFKNAPPCASPFKTRNWEEGDSRFSETTVTVGGRTLRSLARRDKDIATTWTLKHLCADADDLRAFLELPETTDWGEPDVSAALAMEAEIGDAGILLLNTSDPIGHLAPLLEMGEFTIVALTEPELCHRALERFSREILGRVSAFAQALPGRLWRICGPEYVSEPYLPPEFFEQYVTRYDKPLVEAIQKHGGFARIHSHGRLRNVLAHIAATGCDGLDPIEPPRQGDVSLAEVRRAHGKQMALFGNLESTDIENLPTKDFIPLVDRALREGTEGEGRGFVLMPSACPYGRKLPPLAMKNYEAMLDRVERL